MYWPIIVISCICFSILPAAAQGPAARVVVDQVFEKELAKTTAILGVVDFDVRSGISAEVSGLISSENLTEGTVIKKGAVVTKLNTDFLHKDVEVLKHQIRLIGVKIDNTRKNLKRYAVLYKEEATSEKVYEDLSDGLKELEIQRQISRLDLEKKQLEIQKSTIRAPFDALVLAEFKNPGEWISPGMAIGTLASIEHVYVRVAVSETLSAFIKLGQSLTLTIHALQKELQGRIAAMVPVADPKSKTFEIKIGVDYVPGMIQNMSVTVNVPAGRRETLKMIKRDALVRHQGKDFVYTVKSGKAAILPIQIVAIDGEYIGVNAPYIAVGMPVVVDGNDRLRPDQAVEIVDRQ